MRIECDEHDDGWVASSPHAPGAVGLGETPEQARAALLYDLRHGGFATGTDASYDRRPDELTPSARY